MHYLVSLFKYNAIAYKTTEALILFAYCRHAALFLCFKNVVKQGYWLSPEYIISPCKNHHGKNSL